jgi:VWFA-related protein
MVMRLRNGRAVGSTAARQRLIAGCTALLLFATVPAALAQTRPNPPQAAFKAGITIVEVAAVVVDTQGAPVRDLTEHDFRVLEDGQPKPLVSFSRSDHSGPSLAPAAVVSGVPSTSVTTNRDTADAPVFVLLLDDLNISPYRTHRAIRGGLGLLSAIPMSALVGVVTSSGVGSATLNLGHPDSSHEAQVRAFRGQLLVQGRAGDKLNFVTSGSSTVAAQCGAGSANRNSGSCPDPARATRRLRVLESVARSLARAGSRRKVLFWVTEDMGVTPLNPSEGQRAQREALQAVLAADVAVYPVHPDELPFAPERDPGGTLMVGSTTTGGGSMEMTADDYAAVTLDQMARESGGRWIVDVNNHERVLADVVRQNSVSYLLAYESTSGTQAGRRRIDVRVERRGVRVYARRGYMVAASTTKTEAFASATGPVAKLSELLSSVVPHGDLELRVAVAPMLPRGKQGWAVVTVGVDRISADGQPVVLGILTVNGEGSITNRQVLRMNAPPEIGPWEVTMDLPLSKGEHQLRIAAVTADERHQGLVALPVVVPNEPKALWMGPPMLLATARNASVSQLRPTTARNLLVGTPIAVSAQVAGRHLPSTTRTGRLRLVDASGATRVEAETAFEKAAEGNSGLLSGVLSTETLRPGNYSVVLEAEGTKKEKVAQALTITLVPAAPGLSGSRNGTPVRVAYGRLLSGSGPETLVIREHAEWQRFWARLPGSTPLPDIDFARFTLVAVVLDAGSGETTPVIDTAERVGATTILTWRSGPPSSPGRGDGHQHGRPFDVAAIPRSTEAIEFRRRP